MSEEEALPPCPFCGNSARLIHDTTSDYREHWSYRVTCETDDCVEGSYFDKAVDAVERWNRRSAPVTEPRGCPTPGAVAVNVLAWRTTLGDDCCADALFGGIYCIQFYHGMEMPAKLHTVGGWIGAPAGMYATMDAAKAAAQADYEARIRSALVAHPVPALGEVGELVEDARDMASVGADLMAAIEAVQHEDSEYKNWSPADSPAEIVTDLFEDLAAAEAEVSRLREALKPFAEYMGDGMDLDDKGSPLPDDQGVGWIYLTHAHFRRARALLEEPK